jgi:hypothetical protein
MFVTILSLPRYWWYRGSNKQAILDTRDQTYEQEILKLITVTEDHIYYLSSFRPSFTSP